MRRALVYTPQARDDLDGIFDFIAVTNPRRARTYIDEIRAACSTLCDTPMIGTERPDLRAGLRVLPLWRRIVIAYELPPDRVDILRIFARGRNYDAILGG
ncbi:type II toxin-antitoxin system RelE/ParE family toxin [Beijerinckia sp. L45]|uniref:type II toxin-antitoxin system RelE/ParE family toxin n=1 Tax=Beijerinckia sp. L45 TaxID=1641855 RepID=UPI00131DCE3C|nr:type II toxin-antitoxin system RelE/ParE family toxin [Beijerinckia sp. L45]